MVIRILSELKIASTDNLFENRNHENQLLAMMNTQFNIELKGN